ncbi:MAG: ROK family protein [Chloroflexi bacterium]|nr:ROK family protein [Chloroflexota bacterium]
MLEFGHNHHWAVLPTLPSPRSIPLSRPPVLALDLGGTRIRAAVVQSDGSRLARVDMETPTEDGPAAVVRACREAVAESRSKVPADVAESIVGIGISSPGPVDPARGVIVEPPNLGPDFRNVLIADTLSTAEGLPAFLERDTNIAALGEHAFGAARGVDDFIYITVSTGVGGAIVTGGKLLHGPDGLAGELGHVPVSLDGPLCGCGGIGHVEAYASGTALAREARALVVANASQFLVDRARRLGGPSELSAKDVAEGALAGDRACTELMERARRALAAACVGYVNAFNPHRIVIGGSIAEAEGDRMLGPIRDAIAREAFEAMARHVRVVPAALGGDVSLAGAYPLVISRLADLPPESSASPQRSEQPAATTARR